MTQSSFYETLGISPREMRDLARRHGLARLAVFGSFARGEQTEDSDIDLLAEWLPGDLTFSRYMGVIEDLQAATRRKVDLVTPDALHWYIKDKILREAEDLL